MTGLIKADAFKVIEQEIAVRYLPPKGEEPMDLKLVTVAYALLDQLKAILKEQS